MNTRIKFYKDRVSLNVLASSFENAIKCFDLCEGNIIIGLLSKNYDSVSAAVKDMAVYQEKLNGAISVGLGGGDAKQTIMVREIAELINPQHVNQVFPAVGSTRVVCNEDVFINALVSPSGRVGYVNISTGPLSQKQESAIVSVDAAIALIKDMGGNSIKFFPMRGLDTLEEYKEVAKACAKNDFGLEPTGGINMDNFEEIIMVALNAGVKKIIPHVYSSILDKKTGHTNLEDVSKLYQIIKESVDKVT